jgi:hypothetical protein
MRAIRRHTFEQPAFAASGHHVEQQRGVIAPRDAVHVDPVAHALREQRAAGRVAADRADLREADRVVRALAAEPVPPLGERGAVPRLRQLGGAHDDVPAI